MPPAFVPCVLPSPLPLSPPLASPPGSLAGGEVRGWCCPGPGFPLPWLLLSGPGEELVGVSEGFRR